VIGTKDEVLVAHVIKHGLLQPVVAVFMKNVSRYNLANSAVIEMFDFIRRENIKPLVAHVAETYRPLLKDIKYVTTFDKLFLRYEQNREAEASASVAMAASQQSRFGERVHHRDAPYEDEYFNEEDEDEYFNEDEDEEPPMRARRKLVSYDDVDVDAELSSVVVARPVLSQSAPPPSPTTAASGGSVGADSAVAILAGASSLTTTCKRQRSTP